MWLQRCFAFGQGHVSKAVNRLLPILDVISHAYRDTAPVSSCATVEVAESRISRIPTFNGVDFAVKGVGYRFETKMAVEIWNLLRTFTCLIFCPVVCRRKPNRPEGVKYHGNNEMAPPLRGLKIIAYRHAIIITSLRD